MSQSKVPAKIAGSALVHFPSSPIILVQAVSLKILLIPIVDTYAHNVLRDTPVIIARGEEVNLLNKSFP